MASNSIFKTAFLLLIACILNTCIFKPDFPELRTEIETFYVAGGTTVVHIRGTITDDGGTDIIERGICWSEEPAPTILDYVAKDDGTDPHTFVSGTWQLKPLTKYYLNTWATNAAGTGYGNIVTFSTPAGGDEVITLLPPDIPAKPFPSNNADSIQLTTYFGFTYSHGTFPPSHSHQSPPISYSLFLDTLALPTNPLATGVIPMPASIDMNVQVTVKMNNMLLPGAKYYWKVIVKDIRGVSRSTDVWNFKTIKVHTTPRVETGNAENLTGTTAVLTGRLIYNGGSTVTEYGFFTGPFPNPETSGTKILVGNDMEAGDFSYRIAGLTPSNNYYVKAYAINIKGRVLGLETSFKTNPGFDLPVLKTLVSYWDSVSSISGGVISYDGGAGITERGICWNTSGNPVISDNMIREGSGSGHFVCRMNGLNTNATYYIKAYAVNSAGIAYGNELSVKPKKGIIGDINGNEYTHITVGNKTWLAQNLRTTYYSNGDPIGTTTTRFKDISGESQPQYCWPSDGGSSSTYGLYYTWYAVSNSLNVCPSGWHVSSEAEWNELITALGGNAVAGAKLKRTTGWWSPNTGATNESGFSAMPAEYRNPNGFFATPGQNAYFWTSTSLSSEAARCYILRNNSTMVFESAMNSRAGLSVRCVRD